LKKRKLDGEANSEADISDLISIGSSPGSPGPFVDILGNPNGTAERWDEIDDCYVEEDKSIPVWADLIAEDAASLDAHSPPMVIDDFMLIKNQQMREAYGDSIDLELTHQREDEYMREHGGDGAWYITSPACKHKAHVETIAISDQCEETCRMEIDRSLLKYQHMIATGDVKPELCFSCMDCNDECNCKTGADWIMDSGASKHFTSNLDDFSSYEELPNAENALVLTAANSLSIVGKGMVIIRHNVEDRNISYERTTHLYPVFYVPGLTV
jgi:hypothetical protein